MKEPTLDELNTMFQDFQEELVIKESKLKYPVKFTDDKLDTILSLLDFSDDNPSIKQIGQTLLPRESSPLPPSTDYDNDNKE